MNRAELTSFNTVEIPRRVMLEALNTEPGCECADASEDCTLLQIRFLILTYVALASISGLPPYPAMLPHLGWAGQVLHVLFAEAETWRAFRTLVERSHDIPRVTSLTEDDVTFSSLRVRLVYRALRTISGVTHVEPHPLIPGGLRGERASFLVSAATGLTAFVEVAMDGSSMNGQRAIPAEHRDDPLQRSELYRKAGIEPVVIWHSEVDAPRILEERLNDVRARLGLPTRPPSSSTWYEEVS